MQQFIKALLCLLLPFVAVNTMSAQGLGLRVAVIFANQDFSFSNFTYDESTRTGLDIALLYEAVISDNVAIQPELHVVQKGTKIVIGDETKVRLNYAELPILLKLAILGDVDGLSISAFGGPSLAYALDGIFEDDTSKEDIEFDGDYKRFDLGAHLGAELSLPLGNLAFFGDVRYMFGIADISDDPDGEIKNKGLSIGVGIIF